MDKATFDQHKLEDNSLYWDIGEHRVYLTISDGWLVDSYIGNNGEFEFSYQDYLDFTDDQDDPAMDLLVVRLDNGRVDIETLGMCCAFLVYLGDKRITEIFNKLKEIAGVSKVNNITEKPCSFCGKMNDIGIKSCWNCCRNPD